MQAQCFVERGEKVRRNDTDSGSDALNRHRSDLFGLGFRVAIKSRVRGRQEHLEWVDTLGVRSDWDNRDDPSSEPFGGGVGAVVADNHRGPPLVGLGAPHGFEIDEADLASSHQLSPSLAVASQSASSSPFDHASHASS